MAKSKIESNPFTKEVQNATRISLILVDIGGDILRKRLHEIILNNNHQARFDKESYANVKDYFKRNERVYNDNSHFFKEQINAMYPNSNPATDIMNNEKFDITLTTLIFQKLVIKPSSGWSSENEPRYKDKSLGANIMRIKMIRNVNYAHVHRFGIKESEMKRLNDYNENDYPKGFSILGKLEYAIYSLCKDSKEINEYKGKIDLRCNSQIDEAVVLNYKNKIANMIAKDTEFHEFLVKEIEKQGKQNETVIRLLEETKRLDKKNFEKVKNSQLKLIKIFENKFESMMTRQEYREELKELENVLVDKLDDQKSDISQVRDIIIQNSTNTNLNDITNCKTLNIEDLKSYFDEELIPIFKILILDYHEFHNIDDEEKEKLINSIAFSKWNIIVDLNSKRSRLGIDSEICKVYEKIFKINFIRKKIDEKASITDSDRHCIVNNTLLCYFFLNESINHEIPDNFNDEFRMFLEEIKFTQKSVMCTNLFLRHKYTHEYLDQIEEINKAVKAAVYKANKKEILDLIYVFIDNNVTFSDVQNAFGRKINNVEKKIFQTSLFQFISDMAPNIIINEKTFYLPKRNEQRMVWDDKYNCYSSFIEVYHDKIGEKNFMSEDERKKFAEEKKRQFFLGNEIDPETIYINDDMTPTKFSTYVDRKKINEYVDHIKKKSMKNDFYKNNQLVRNIYHSPFAGGTTFGRIILYRLRLKLPCMRLIYLDQDDKLIECLRDIKEKSDLPLVILIDKDTSSGSNEMNADRVHEFSNRLHYTENIMHFIIYIQRSFDSNDIPEYEPNEVDAFENLYDGYLENNSSINSEFESYSRDIITIRLRSLQKTQTNIEDIKKIATKYCKLLREEDMSLIILLFFYNKYSLGQHFNTDLIAFILKLQTQKSLRQLFTDKIKGNQHNRSFIFHLLLYNNKQNAFKMINYDFFEIMIEIIGEHKKKHKLELFLEEYYKLIDEVLLERNDALTDPLIKATQLLFITEGTKRQEKKNQQKNDEDDEVEGDDDAEEDADLDRSFNDQDKKNSFYTKLIVDIEDFYLSVENTVEKVENIFIGLYNKFKEIHEISPYLGSLQARYVFHSSNLFEEKLRAVNIIKTAFGIKDSIKNSINRIQKHDLYGAYGDLMRHYAMENIKQAIRNSSSNFELAYQFAEESIHAYSKSIDLAEDKKKELPLIGECTLRKNILFHYFNDVCKTQKEFTHNIKNKKAPHIVSNSFEKLPQQLDRLERLHIVYSTGYNYNLQELYYECRIKFCELLYSIGKLKSFEQINNIPIREDINLYRVIKSLNKDNKKFCHKDISAVYLNMIIDRYEKQYKEKKDSFRSILFHDLIQAYIHLANKDKDEQKSMQLLKKALSTAKEWKRIYENDEDAHFYFSIFQLVSAIQTIDKDKKIESLAIARKSFEKCTNQYEKKYKKIGMPQKWLKKEFLLGKDLGLRGLIIFDLNKNLSDLESFEGDIEVNNKGQLFINFHDLHLKYLPKLAIDKESEVREAEKGQRQRYKYHFCISRKNFLMYKYEKK